MTLNGKNILVTGVSRTLGIGATLARRFAQAGARVAVHGFSGYDLTVGEKNGASPNGTENVAKTLTDMGLDITLITPSDFTQTGTAKKAVEEAAHKLGRLDGLVLNHCYGTRLKLGEWTEENLDPHFTVNIHACMLMLQAFAQQVDVTRHNAITLFTSGQANSPMPDETPYCVAKEAITNLCRQTMTDLGKLNTRINVINPGSNDTGYYNGDTKHEPEHPNQNGVQVRYSGWCTPDDAADLALFLHSDYAKCITGQVIASDKGEGFGGAFVL